MPKVELKRDIPDAREARERAARGAEVEAPPEQVIQEVKKEWQPPKRGRGSLSRYGTTEFQDDPGTRRKTWLPRALVDGTVGWASQEIVRSTGLTDLQIQELKRLKNSGGQSTQFYDRARVLMDEGVVTTGATLKNIADHAKARAVVYGKKIGGLIRDADAHIEENPDQKDRLPNGHAIAQRIRNDIVARLSRPADAEIIDRLERDASSFERKKLTFSETLKLKGSYDKYLYGENPVVGPIYDELHKVRRVISEELDQAVEAVLADIDPEKHGQFQEAKLNFFHLQSTAEVASLALIQRETANNSATSYRLTQWAAAGVAAGLGWLLGLIFQFDPHMTAAVSGAAGTASVATKAISHYLGDLTPGSAAPLVYRALKKTKPKPKAE